MCHHVNKGNRPCAMIAALLMAPAGPRPANKPRCQRLDLLEELGSDVVDADGKTQV